MVDGKVAAPPPPQPQGGGLFGLGLFGGSKKKEVLDPVAEAKKKKALDEALSIAPDGLSGVHKGDVDSDDDSFGGKRRSVKLPAAKARARAGAPKASSAFDDDDDEEDNEKAGGMDMGAAKASLFARKGAR